MKNQNIEQLKIAIEPYRNKLLKHPVYESLHTLQDVAQFMEVHVHAVWDFMVLLKGLQRNLTCMDFIWRPVGNATTRFLINEIVLGEESDIHPDGGYTSHFELYLNAMKAAGADTEPIKHLIADLPAHAQNPKNWLDANVDNEIIRQFNNFTLQLVMNESAAVQAAVFTFGREDLIPDMFLNLVNHLHKQYPDELATFKYYLERHIEVDGDHHSHLALEMTALLCGEDANLWQRATEASIKALEMRYKLWDAVLEKNNILTA